MLKATDKAIFPVVYRGEDGFVLEDPWAPIARENLRRAAENERLRARLAATVELANARAALIAGYQKANRLLPRGGSAQLRRIVAAEAALAGDGSEGV